MRKTKVVVICVLVVALLIGFITKTKAVTVSPTLPETVYAGESFELVLSFEKKVSALTGRIKFDGSAVEVDSNNAEYVEGKSTGSVTLTSFAMNDSDAKTSFKVKFKAKQVESQKTVEFSLADFTVAFVDRDGGECTGTYTVTINTGTPPISQQLTLSKEQVNLKVGESETVSAQGMGTIRWSSSDTNIATVNNGTITAVAEGSTTIVVTDESSNKRITVNVTKAEENNNGGGQSGEQNGGNSNGNQNGGESNGGSSNGGQSGETNQSENGGSSNNNGSSSNSNSGSSSSSSTENEYYVSSSSNSTSPRKISQTGETGIIVGVIAFAVIVGYVFRKKSK